MTEKILNLKLKYKNKLLDIAKYKRDFTTNFYVGKNRKLFWQILDDSFPDKFRLISRKTSGFSLHLRPDMDIEVDKEGEKLSKQLLTNKNLLKNNSLDLDFNSNGTITFSDDWSIEYFFLPARIFEPTHEELAIKREFAHWPKINQQERVTRIFLLLGLLITIVGLTIGESFYVPPPIIDFTKRLELVHEMATRVESEVIEEPVVEPEVKVDITEEKPKTEEDAEVAVKQSEESSLAQYEEMFGSIDGAYDNYEAELFELEFVEDIAVIDYDEPAETAANVVKTSDASILEKPADTGGTSLSDIKSSGKELFDIDDLDLDTDLGLEEVSFEDIDLTGQDLTIKRIESKKQFEAAKRSFSNIKVVQEKEIELDDVVEDQSNDASQIKQTINAYKPQITKLYMVETMMVDMYGTIEFDLIIDNQGKVVAVNSEAIEGSFFTDDFLNKCSDIISKWNIPVSEAVNYSFRMKFIKQ